MSKPREFWLDEKTEFFHEYFPEYLTKEPHCHDLVHVVEKAPVDKLLDEVDKTLLGVLEDIADTKYYDAAYYLEKLKLKLKEFRSNE